jgi:hypothetical protein
VIWESRVDAMPQIVCFHEMLVWEKQESVKPVRAEKPQRRLWKIIGLEIEEQANGKKVYSLRGSIKREVKRERERQRQRQRSRERERGQERERERQRQRERSRERSRGRERDDGELTRMRIQPKGTERITVALMGIRKMKWVWRRNWERQTDRERERERERQTDREREVKMIECKRERKGHFV